LDNYHFWLGENKKTYVDIFLEQVTWPCYIHRSSNDEEHQNVQIIVSRNVKGEIVYERF
jgi:hypothetical protein